MAVQKSLTQYKQCLLGKDESVHTAWIPVEFAKQSKVVKIKINGEWDDGWKVLDTYGVMTQEQLNNQRAAQQDIAEVLEGH